jgi:hypothetical protein
MSVKLHVRLTIIAYYFLFNYNRRYLQNNDNYFMIQYYIMDIYTLVLNFPNYQHFTNTIYIC